MEIGYNLAELLQGRQLKVGERTQEGDTVEFHPEEAAVGSRLQRGEVVGVTTDPRTGLEADVQVLVDMFPERPSKLMIIGAESIASVTRRTP